MTTQGVPPMPPGHGHPGYDKHPPLIQHAGSMNPGPELNNAVASALGAVYLGDIHGRFGIHTWLFPFPLPFDFQDHSNDAWVYHGNQHLTPETVGHTPHFSTDWNDAMWAAEKAGLFSFHVLRHDGQNWALSSTTGAPAGWDEFKDIAAAPTGPHAICLAILKLKNNA